MFNPMRLEVARKRRQLTKIALAKETGITPQTLTRLEQKDIPQQPELKTVQLLATALKYPVEFFFLDDCEELIPENVSFRSMSSMTARQRDAALAAGSLAFEIDDWVTERFDLPVLDLPDLHHEPPTVAARVLRAYWGIGYLPVPNMVKLLEAKGLRIFSLSEPHKNVDAYACWRSKNNKAYIFLNTFKSAERSRWDAAHELGHLVLHRHSLTQDRDVESEANEFASAFLMPREDLISHLRMRRSLNDLIKVKARWKVSVAALARTAHTNGLISEWHYRELCQQMIIYGYRSREPNSIPHEKSVVWQKVFESLWRDGLTKDHVAKSMCFPSDEIDAVIGEIYGQPTQSPPVKHSPNLKLVR